jgi:hypothetical protein
MSHWSGFTLSGNAHDHLMKAARQYAMGEGLASVAKHQCRPMSLEEAARYADYLRAGDAEQALAEQIDPRARVYCRIGYPTPK